MSQHDPYGATGPVQSPAPPPYPEQGYPQEGQSYGQPAYDQGYGQPAYPPAGSPPQGYGYGFDTGPQRTNLMAILGLVFAFVFSPLGIVFSAIGLSQVGKRREKGRGLAIAGLILSIAFLLIGILMLIFVLPAAKTAVDSAAAADRLASSAPTLPSDVASDTGAADTGSTGVGGVVGDDKGVLAACKTIIPALLNLETEMQDVSTPAEYSAALSKLESTLTTAAGGTSDPTFAQQVAQLNADLEKASAAVQHGDDASSLESALNADGEAVGTTCGTAGFTD